MEKTSLTQQTAQRLYTLAVVEGRLRPGEKLYEEKLMAEEGLKKTENELIHIGKPISFDVETFLKQLEELAKASYENSDRIVEMVELPDHPFYIGTQAHPEFKSRPNHAHPLFRGLVAAALERKNSDSAHQIEIE